MTSFIIPNPATGNNRRITLSGNDLIFEKIDNIFVYPSLDIDRLKNALSRSLSIWPILAGRVLVDNDQYMIELSDQAIPFTYAENTELENWPNLPVVIDDNAMCESFVDMIKQKPNDEPLIRIKVTVLLRSNEYILGASFSHLVGDAATNLHFLNDLSRLYQDLEPNLPRPVFDRHLWTKEDADPLLLSKLKPYQKAGKRELVLADIANSQKNTDQVNISFSSIQLDKLRNLICDDNVTINDALCAYIAVTMNKASVSLAEKHFQRAYTIVNCRDTSYPITPMGHVANSIVIMLTSDFPDPCSLTSVAKTIRQAIKKCREKDFLNQWLPTADLLMRQILQDDRYNCVWDTDEAVFNSNFRFDWSNQVDFGMTNQCRFHTTDSLKGYFRIFRLNPIKDNDGKWTKADNGAEVSFRIDKGEMKSRFLDLWQHDIVTDFINVQR